MQFNHDRADKPELTPTAGPMPPRVLGVWAAFGPMVDPGLFLRSDDELEAMTAVPVTW